MHSLECVMNFVRPGGGSGPVWLGHAHLILFRFTAFISKKLPARLSADS
ncbi:hypothetical protein Q669_01925 [Labrenzia sp. C1B10]|nr:hypothetical protein Q669_01925 [Labrenzia sp. C1B10]ERS05548.1 hypothetical protein Q675_04000 [Labrenzia sp. C1B70]